MAKKKDKQDGSKGGRHVVFVHGTWAHGILKSVFWRFISEKKRAALKAKVPELRSALEDKGIKTHDFIWSGKNGHWSRRNAGKALAEMLKKIAADHKPSTLHVISHSHGGNVSLYAAEDKAALKSLDGLACLATPFLYFEPRQLDMSVFRALPLALGFLAFAIVMVPLMVFTEDYAGLPQWAVILGNIALSAGIAYLMARFIRGRVRDIEAQAMAANDLCEEWEPVLPDALNIRLMRKTGDEASAALMAGRLIEWIITLVWRGLSSVSLNRMSVLGAAIAIAAFGGMYYYIWTQAPDGPFVGSLMLAVLMTIVLVAAMQIALSIAIIALSLLRFGLSKIFSTVFIRVTVAEVKEGYTDIRFFRSTGSSPLEHSEIYRDPAAIKSLVDWVLENR